MRAADFQPKGKADWAATVFGVLAVPGGGWLLYEDLIPWYAFLAMFFFGAFLILPARTKIFGRQLTEWIPKIRGD